jgi:branched-chain amino acid transport system substrate-binding protein
MKELRRQGHNSMLIGAQIFADPDIAKVLGSDGEGATFVSWYWWDTNERTRTFERKFLDEAKKRGVNKSGAHHVDASAYDIVYVFADAMRRANVSGDPAKLKAERTAIRDTLRSTQISGATLNCRPTSSASRVVSVPCSTATRPTLAASDGHFRLE